RKALWNLIGRRWKRFGFPEAAFWEKIPSGSASSAMANNSLIPKRSGGRAPTELLDIERILVDVFEGANEEDMEWRSSYPRPFLVALLRAARSAADLTVAEKQRKKVSSTSAHVHSFRISESSVRSVCPTPVRAEQDSAVLARFAANVFAEIRTPTKREKFVTMAKHWLESRRDERNGLEFSFDQRALSNG